MNTSEFEEGRKIKLLCSKLFGSATDCVTTFQLRYPREAKDFSKIRQCLQERYHGGDSRKIYLTEYNNCIRNPGESIRDYACRIQKLFSFAYPTKEGKWVDLEMTEQLIMDKFLGGLKPNLRERMSFKEFKNLDSLIKATENCAAVLNEAKLERRNVEFINAVASNSNTISSSETKGKLSELEATLKNNQKLMSELMQQNQETAKLLNKVVQAQTQTNFRSQPAFQPQTAFQPQSVFQSQTGFQPQPVFQAQAVLPARSIPQSQQPQNCVSQFEQNPQGSQQPNSGSPFGQRQLSQRKLKTTFCNVGNKGGPCPKPRQNVNEVRESRKNKIPRLKLQVGDVKFFALVDSGAGRSLIKTEILQRIGHQIKNFSTDAPVELFGVDNTRLRTRGTVTLEMNVLGDDLLQEFIVVDRINEDCILGLDALYEHKFIIDGSKRTIYRVKETKEDTASAPAIITKNRITIKPFSATVVESDGEGGKLPQNITCYLERGPGLHSGLRVDPFVCSVNDLTVFSVVLINETNEPITVPKFQRKLTLNNSRSRSNFFGRIFKNQYYNVCI
ncbi:hypothetical protein GHT06_015272 [Daphnia sinensis]|uniref:Peptidase A2 domain-containing protein n=1 Tax=Daphnia sinensis TaxID=1820382 RepID=A0AAD5LAS3_9CRUS|nr:hypothetical protein GHT06_015272 [Daphnia sinensis]